MIKIPRSTPTSWRGKVRQLAYSPTSKRLARRVVSTVKDTHMEKALETRGLDGPLRRISSENLPQGRYFAKLTIKDWEKFNGQSFVLKQNGKPVYGNKIEPSARGFPLEYRNIVVTSQYPGKFSLNVPAEFTLSIGFGAFSTPQEVSYDRQYGVQQEGDVFYSLRGNLTDPDRILITFPVFGPSTSMISYTVSYLKQITDADLSKTLMICFQDRYMRQHSITDDRMMMFGASKGGSTTLLYAREYPNAHLVVAVPQMSLPYYMSKPLLQGQPLHGPGDA